MIFKNYLLDIYLLLGLVLFTLGKIFDPLFTSFYIFINLLGLIILILQFVNLNLKLRVSSVGLVIISLSFYLIGNIIFIKDLDLGFLNLSDFFFIVQIVIKQYFLLKSQNILDLEQIKKYITTINLIVIFISFILSNLSFGHLLDLYYLTESFVSMVILIIFNLYLTKVFINFSLIDLDFFFIGQLFWLVGDIIYSNERLLSYNIFKDSSDIIFFIGFYFFVKSFSSYKYLFNYNIVKI